MNDRRAGAFLVDEVVDRFRFMAQNNKLVAEGKKPVSGHPLLLGITKARRLGPLTPHSPVAAVGERPVARLLES